MSSTKLLSRILIAATAILIAVPPVNAQQKTIDGDDDEWFMEETGDKSNKPASPAKIPDTQAQNLNVPMTEDGRIIPLKNDNTPIMPQQSQLQVTNEYVIQPGAYYPGMPQMNMPYGGIATPYYAPGVMPYRPGINIGLGRAGNINIGGAGYNPYGYGYPGYGNYGYGAVPYAPLGSPFFNRGVAPGIGGFGGMGGFGGYGVPGVGMPGMGVPAIPGVTTPAGIGIR